MVDLWLTIYIYNDYWDICLGLWDSIGCIYIYMYIYTLWGPRSIVKLVYSYNN